MIRVAAALFVLLTCTRAPPPGRAAYPEAELDPRWRALVAKGPALLARDAIPLATACPAPETLLREAHSLATLEASRTPADVARIRSEVGDLVPLFLKVVGHTRTSAPALARALDEAIAEVDYFLFAEKIALMCPRPHHVLPSLRPAIPVPRHPAYPSGHGGEAMVLAAVAAMVYPEHAEALQELARGVAGRRELAGVHFASDSAEGRRIGAAVAEALSKARWPALERARNTAKQPRKAAETIAR